MNQQETALPTWRKSSRCDAGSCVEVAHHGGAVGVRDNTQPDIHLHFDGDSWRSLLRDIRDGRLSR